MIPELIQDIQSEMTSGLQRTFKITTMQSTYPEWGEH